MGKAGTSIALAAALFAGEARAQRAADPLPPPPPPTVDAGSASTGNAASPGAPCARSLDALDRAIVVSIEPTLRRDRGLCHEHLGHPYPAVDDYRAYLMARPDAPDADDVRSRLERLEAETGIVAKDAAVHEEAGGRRMRSRARDKAGEGTGRTLADNERDERLDTEAAASPLRRGKGLVLGIELDFTHVGKETVGWTETLGVDLRYSVSKVSTLLLEVGFAYASSTGAASSLGGSAAAVGYEARIGLDSRLDDALLLGVTLGYQGLTQRGTGLHYTVVLPEARLGYRHVFGPSLGLEGTFDGGAALLHLRSAPSGTDANQVVAVLGGHVALVVGF
jgi:hypothetical protein